MPYSLDHLRKEILGENAILVPQISKSSEKLFSSLEKAESKTKINSEFHLTGSTNQRRNTFIIDPKNRDFFPIDYDVIIKTPFYDDENKLNDFLKNVSPDISLKRNYGKYNACYSECGFQYEIKFEDLSSQSDPLVYSSNVSIDREQVIEIQMLKLLSMRAGIYGGFQNGIKGVALEQLVLREGNLKESLVALPNYISSSDAIVCHPNGKNLLQSLSLDMKLRVSSFCNHINGGGEIPVVPFSGFRDNKKSIFSTIEGSSPRKMYTNVLKYLSKSGCLLENLSIIPEKNRYHIFLKVQGEEFQKNNLNKRLGLSYF